MLWHLISLLAVLPKQNKLLQRRTTSISVCFDLKKNSNRKRCSYNLSIKFRPIFSHSKLPICFAFDFAIVKKETFLNELLQMNDMAKLFIDSFVRQFISIKINNNASYYLKKTLSIWDFWEWKLRNCRQIKKCIKVLKERHIYIRLTKNIVIFDI